MTWSCRSSDLTREGKFVDVSFELRAGEIVGLAGLVGAGRTEIAEAIFGIDRYDAGIVEVAGQPLKNGSPTAAMRAGIALVPEDRRQHGLVMESRSSATSCSPRSRGSRVAA